MTENHEFNKIYEKYKHLILKIAYMYVKDRDIAEDIAQETFEKLFLVMDREEEIRNIESWLSTTAKHAAINHYKKIAKWEVRTEDVIYSKDSENPVEFEPVGESLEEEYMDELTNKEKAELHNRIMTELMEKNPRWYDAILLEAHLEVPQKDAAKMMHMSLNAYQVMLHRAREWIRSTFGVEYEELKRK